MYGRLSSYKPGTSGFNSAWKSLANTNGSAFDAVQHSFIKKNHFDPAKNTIQKNLGIDITRYPKAVQDVLWSTAVQHGSYGAMKVFRNAGIRSGMGAADIIRRVYAERSANNGLKWFKSSSSSIRKGVVNRFKNELRDALNMLG